MNVVTYYNIFASTYDIKQDNNMYRLAVLGLNLISGKFLKIVFKGS